MRFEAHPTVISENRLTTHTHDHISLYSSNTLLHCLINYSLFAAKLTHTLPQGEVSCACSAMPIPIEPLILTPLILVP